MYLPRPFLMTEFISWILCPLNVHRPSIVVNLRSFALPTSSSLSERQIAQRARSERERRQQVQASPASCSETCPDSDHLVVPLDDTNSLSQDVAVYQCIYGGVFFPSPTPSHATSTSPSHAPKGRLVLDHLVIWDCRGTGARQATSSQ